MGHGLKDLTENPELGGPEQEDALSTSRGLLRGVVNERHRENLRQLLRGLTSVARRNASGLVVPAKQFDSFSPSCLSKARLRSRRRPTDARLTFSPMPLPDPQRLGILELLDSSKPLRTPPFQRSFAWSGSEVDDFWNDLRRAIDTTGGPSDYFLGLVVLDDKERIQDGQQRLATTLLLSSEIYEATEDAKKLGAYDPQLAIDAAGAVLPALRQSPTAKLEISLQDQDVLLKRAGVRPDSPESTKRLAAARDVLKRHLSVDLAARTTPDAKLARLKQWGEFLRSEAYVVVLRVPPRDAHNIFETLNTRGVRLSNGDLVKSHLIGRSSDAAVAVSKWDQVTAALTDAAGRYEDDLESFLLHYFGSRYKRTTKGGFFSDYRKEVEAVDSFDALDTLILNAKLYRALAAPGSSSAFWDAIGPGAQQAIELVNGLGLKQLRYLLLAVLRDLGQNQADAPRRKKQRDAVVQIASWSVRGLVDGRTGGGEAERTYINAAAGIRSGALNTVDKLRSDFTTRGMFIADDDLFKEKFLAFQWDRANSHTRARAVLLALEYHELGTKAAIQPRDTLTVEHVLPQSPNPGEWQQFSDDERAVYAYDIGNLLLIDGPSRANDLLGNHEWPAKKALVKSWGSQTPLTEAALKLSKWEAATIQKRRKALSEVAARAWRP